MARKVQPVGLTPQPATRPPRETDGQKPAREKRQLPPDKDEISRLINELHAGLTSSDGGTAKEAVQLCRDLALRAVERLALVVTGSQPATVPQVVMSSITILKGAGVVGNAGVTAEATE
jgi:hypothetical protein